MEAINEGTFPIPCPTSTTFQHHQFAEQELPRSYWNASGFSFSCYRQMLPWWFLFFFPTCKCSMRLCKQRTVQWHHVHRGTIHIMSLYIYYYKCLSESSNVYSNQTRILQQFCNKWQGCHLIICMKMPHRLEVVLCSYLDLEHYQLQAGLMKMGQGPPSSFK